jgi:cellobiose phosphorylase
MSSPADTHWFSLLGGPGGPVPAGRILSNSTYRVLLNAAGTGGSSLGPLAVTLCQADPVEDTDGLFIYLRDRQNGRVWTVTPRPLGGGPGGEPTAGWRPGIATFANVQADLSCRLEICVLPEVDCELRRLRVRNATGQARSLEVTSYAEIVLGDPAGHAAHPVFAKLFLQTEFASERALLAWRRPRSATESHPWLVHALVGETAAPVSVPRAARDAPAFQFETDRGRFLGRNLAGGLPRALRGREPLSGTTGSVLDPVLCLRRILTLPAGAEGELTFLLGAASSREQALGLAAGLPTSRQVDEAFMEAETAAATRLAGLGMGLPEAAYWESLAVAMVYGHPGLRAPAPLLAGAAGTPARLEELGIDRTRSLALLLTGDGLGDWHDRLPAALHRGHRYWRSLGLPIQLAVLAPDARTRRGLAEGAPEGALLLDGSELAPGERDLIGAQARLVVESDGELPRLTWTSGRESREKVEVIRPAPAGKSASVSAGVPPPEDESGHAGVPTVERAAADPGVAPGGSAPEASTTAPPSVRPPLSFWNGHGGFDLDAGEYVIHLDREVDGTHRLPPQPWVNILAGERLGCLISERGSGCTWHGNSREHRLTPWANDPVRDPYGEAFYVRDEQSGEFWSLLPGPTPAPVDHEVRHGHGYSRFRHAHDGLVIETEVSVARVDPVRFTTVRLQAAGDETRRLSLFSYYRLVLGSLAADSGRQAITTLGGRPGELLASNRLAGEFGHHVAFAAVVASDSGALRCTGDRAGFLGTGGSPAAPAALRSAAGLTSRTGPGLDPCFAQQVELTVRPGQSLTCVFLLGEGRDPGEAKAHLAHYSSLSAVEAACAEAREAWRERLGRIRVQTGSPALDPLVNGWLPYQTLGCRLWGRTAFYQSGGAFGFRDQLQDASAFLLTRPALLREQLLLHAAHQFQEGDVLHWWHPPAGKGLRTRFADDLLWLPYLSAEYVAATGDDDILEMRAPFLTARLLAAGEDEAYLQPEPSGETGSLYAHCCRAIDRSLAVGAHGLPLFGTGDWNDGMNRVGREGRGESVWMAFFLCKILREWSRLCKGRGDEGRVHAYLEHRARLQTAIESEAWDGEWYRRGYYDDGTPLGSHLSDECRIDGLVQAWSVLSGAADPGRAAQAMRAVERHLVSQKDGLIRLLTPPFDHTERDPGYIKGYVPGVRENGGQYTHAALWVVRAMARLGWRDRVARLLELLNPVLHADSPGACATYRVEPYVMAADVYGEPPHIGRGGWTWYTGSAGWMYRVAIESLLGLRVERGQTLLLRPCIPDEWSGFRLEYRLPDDSAIYDIVAHARHGRPKQVIAAELDGRTMPAADGDFRVPLQRDGGRHRLLVALGPGRGEGRS